MNYLILVSFFFLGFSLGRLGHIYFGQIKSPHHWIYGFAGIIGGLFLFQFFWGVFLFILGLGVFISDLKDFSKFRFYGKDNDPKRTFWNID